MSDENFNTGGVINWDGVKYIPLNCGEYIIPTIHKTFLEKKKDVDEIISILMDALDKVVSFDSENEKVDFLLDVLYEVKIIINNKL